MDQQRREVADQVAALAAARPAERQGLALENAGLRIVGRKDRRHVAHAQRMVPPQRLHRHGNVFAPEAQEGRFGKVFIDGPMDAKTACDKHSGEIKGLSSPVVGNADILIFPNIESGNTFYKTLSLFGDANMAGMLTGTIAPVVVPSRSDSGNSKYYSLVLACLAGTRKE